MAGPRLDTTLASNVGTAFAPRPDLAIGHGVKYWREQVGQSLSDLGAWLRGRPAHEPYPPRGIPPGNAQVIGDPRAPAAGADTLRTLKCAETGRLHEQLPADKVDSVRDYHSIAQMSFAPQSEEVDVSGRVRGAPWVQDAFRAYVVANGEYRDVLPESLLRSSLLNTRLGSSRGEVQRSHPNTLYDPLTGFAASISLRNDNEVVIGFSGMGSQGGIISQGVRCAMNLMGLTPPKNLAQASKLTQMVKAHLDTLNASLPQDKQLKLKLAGFSMGGGMATYAALRNNVEAVVISPMRLGLLSRAKCGRDAIKNAPRLVTEVSVQGDWVANNSMTRGLKLLSIPSLMLTGRKADPLGAIGHRYLIPKPEVNERIAAGKSLLWGDKGLKSLEKSIDVHVEFGVCLQAHKDRLKKQSPGT